LVFRQGPLSETVGALDQLSSQDSKKPHSGARQGAGFDRESVDRAIIDLAVIEHCLRDRVPNFADYDTGAWTVNFGQPRSRSLIVVGGSGQAMPNAASS
jgi:hypothetical protein